MNDRATKPRPLKRAVVIVMYQTLAQLARTTISRAVGGTARRPYTIQPENPQPATCNLKTRNPKTRNLKTCNLKTRNLKTRNLQHRKKTQ